MILAEVDEKIRCAEICDHLGEKVEKEQHVLLLLMIVNRRRLLKMKGESSSQSETDLEVLRAQWKCQFQ